MCCTDPASCVWTCLSPYKEQISVSGSDTCRNMGRAEQDEFLSDSAEQISRTGVTPAQTEKKKTHQTVNSGWPGGTVFFRLLERICSDVYVHSWQLNTFRLKINICELWRENLSRGPITPLLRWPNIQNRQNYSFDNSILFTFSVAE